jgi:signal transduction histidine kinase
MRGIPPGSDPDHTRVALRELMAVREIVHAFLTADRPEEGYQFALERVSPVVGASFASVYLIDGASEVMRLAASYNWPEKFRPFLGDMRVRLGFGPSGEAASERRAIFVPDVFADSSLEDWQEVAGELGFRALVALPLQTRNRVLGAVTFYYAEAGGLSGEQRGIVRIVADQMAATAEKAALIDELRRANSALQESNAELEKQYVQALEARRVKDEFLTNVSHELRTPLTAVMGYVSLLLDGFAGPLTDAQQNELSQVNNSSERLLQLIDNLLELTSLRKDSAEVHLTSFDPREPVGTAVERVDGRKSGVALDVSLPQEFVPNMRSDNAKVVRILTCLLDNAYKFTEKGEVRISVAVQEGRVFFEVRDTGIGMTSEQAQVIFDDFRQVDSAITRRFSGSGLGLALARRQARLLGGDVTVTSVPSVGSVFTAVLPLEFSAQ